MSSFNLRRAPIIVTRHTSFNLHQHLKHWHRSLSSQFQHSDACPRKYIITKALFIFLFMEYITVHPTEKSQSEAIYQFRHLKNINFVCPAILNYSPCQTRSANLNEMLASEPLENLRTTHPINSWTESVSHMLLASSGSRLSELLLRLPAVVRVRAI